MQGPQLTNVAEHGCRNAAGTQRRPSIGAAKLIEAQATLEIGGRENEAGRRRWEDEDE